ncbi:MAG: aldo/keto reductase [Ilumatobacteraceae bacterium]
MSQLGPRGPEVTALGLGCAPLGNLYSAVSDEDATATVDAAWEVGIRFFDTAPLYGQGLSETRLGQALRSRPREEFVLATKVGRLLRAPSAGVPASIFVNAPPLEATRSYSYDDAMRSVEESLVRLGVDRVDVVHVHDPDDHEDEAIRGAFPALIKLRDQGVIRAVGCGMNQWQMLDRFVGRIDLDCILLAGRYTLLDRSGAERLLPRCLEHRVGVVIGGVFNSGLLADPDLQQVFDYSAAPPALVDRARAMRDTCRRRGVSLTAAALQFALRHPAVTTVVVGARTAAEVSMDAHDAQIGIPADLWDELDRL